MIFFCGANKRVHIRNGVVLMMFESVESRASASNRSVGSTQCGVPYLLSLTELCTVARSSLMVHHSLWFPLRNNSVHSTASSDIFQ